MQPVLGACSKKLKELDTDSMDLMVAGPPYFLDGLDDELRKGKDNHNKATT